MDVTLWRARPRELPLSKPSAEHSYLPKALLRDEDAGTSGPRSRKSRWMPSEKTPGTSKHLRSGDANLNARTRLEPQECVSDLDIQRLTAVEDELTHLETEFDHFVNDFYVAAASFSTQANAQKALLTNLLQRQVSTKTKP